MGLKNGCKSNNPFGRPVGAVSADTKDLRDFLTRLINRNRATIERDLKGMDPENRMMFLIKLMPYVMPPAKEDSLLSKIGKLSDEDADAVIADIKKIVQESLTSNN